MPSLSKTIVLMPGQFAWMLDEENGKVSTLIGSLKLDPSEKQKLLKMNENDPTMPVVLSDDEDRSVAIQRMITIRDGEYATIHNPTRETSDDQPNGSWSAGQKDTPTLLHGQRRIVTSGNFPIWPGQKVDIKPAIALAKEEYIIIQVPEPGKVDTTAPFYGVTVKCALKSVTPVAKVEPAGEGQEPAEGETPSTPAASVPANPAEFKFSPGQQIRISGVDTEVYIPPTGVDVLPDTSVDASGRPLTKELALELLDKVKDAAPAPMASPQVRFRQLISKGALGERDLLSYAPEALRTAQRNYGPEYMNKMPELLDLSQIGRILSDPRFEEPKIDQLKGTAGGFTIKELEEAAKGERIVRTALELTETEFAVIIKADGTQRVVAGPTRLFLEPYERFRTAGANRGVYNAYHPNETQGVLLRVLAKSIRKEELAKELPPGAEEFLDKATFTIGDEIFIKGLAAYIIPSNNFVICDPKTRTPHMGNDHEGIYVEGIRVDQKSAIYIRNLKTGKVTLVKGERLYIPDPRKEEQVFRRLKSHEWNLWVAATERKPRVADGVMTDLLWATCIPVQPNEAMLVTGGERPRVVMGWKRELLEFDESPVTLVLSAGTPKRSKPPIETVILKVADNLVSDTFTITTADNVDLEITLRLKGSFEGTTDDDRLLWWLKTDYVGELIDFVRSKMRGVTHQMKFVEIKDRMADFVRDTLLGKRVEGAGRPGLKMENNFHVTEVMLDDPVIKDQAIKQATIEGQRRIVTANLELTTEEAVRAATVALDGIKTELVQYDKNAIDREDEVETHRLSVKSERDDEAERLRDRHANTVARNKHALADQEAAEIRTRLLEDSEAEVLRIQKRAHVEADAQKMKNDVIAVFQTVMTGLEEKLIGADAEAKAKVFKEVQPSLIAAIQSLGDTNLLAEAAKTIPPNLMGVLADAIKEKGLSGAFSEIFKDTRLQSALDGLKDRMGSSNKSEIRRD